MRRRVTRRGAGTETDARTTPRSPTRALAGLVFNRAHRLLPPSLLAGFKTCLPFPPPRSLVARYLGYSPSGVVEGELVYANYGTTDDFARLTALGVDARGAIALVRYGGIYRGDKVTSSEPRSLSYAHIRHTHHTCRIHHITSHRIASHHITSHHITSHHITPQNITSHHITPHHITPHHIISSHIIPMRIV